MSSLPVFTAPPKKYRNLAQGVVAYIAENIRNGGINPGDKLPTESEIMRIQGVSRTVVREAISHMQASGMVETRHGIGTFVLEPPRPNALGIDPKTVVTMRDVLAILELRISLETEAAGLAALRRTGRRRRGRGRHGGAGRAVPPDDRAVLREPLFPRHPEPPRQQHHSARAPQFRQAGAGRHDGVPGARHP
jgi:DNA-binding transcriptional regulator YhcF (GntR family)